MRLMGYDDNGARCIGAVTGDELTPLGSAAAFYADPAAAMAATGSDSLRVADIMALPPVPDTARIFCVGLNYREHGDEARDLGLASSVLPLIFGRWASTLIVDGQAAPIPKNEPGLDWEVELAVVIGSTARNATPDAAMAHVLGYTAFNDLSARTKQLQTSQFTLGKNADRSGPIGPVIVTADSIDPYDLTLQTRIAGEVMQSAHTGSLIHDIASLIVYISDTVTLQPGDVIATGTPGGCGVAMKPPRFLQPGETVEVEISGIGVLRTPIVAWDAV